MRKTLAAVITALAVTATGALVVMAQTKAHVLQAPAEAAWGPAPPFLAAGAQIAVLSGDPTKPAAYSIRVKFPAGYAIPAHSHPTDENVAIVSGALTFGMGDKLAKGAAGNKTLAPGGYAMMPAGMNHFAYAGPETTIILYGQGPVDFKYVNPADDPRNAKGVKK